MVSAEPGEASNPERDRIFHQPFRSSTTSCKWMPPTCRLLPALRLAEPPRGTATCSRPLTISGLVPRWLIRQAPPCGSTRAWRRWTDALPGRRLRSMSGAGSPGVARPISTARSLGSRKTTGRVSAQPHNAAPIWPSSSKLVAPHSSQSSAPAARTVPQRGSEHTTYSRRSAARAGWVGGSLTAAAG